MISMKGIGRPLESLLIARLLVKRHAATENTCAGHKLKRLVLQPPGATAVAGEMHKFSKRVNEVLFQRGKELQVKVRGVAATRNVLRALTDGTNTADFEVNWAGAGGGNVGGDRALRFTARPGISWEKHMSSRLQNTPSFTVQNETNALKLARAIAKEEAKSGALRVFMFLDDDSAVSTLVKALAIAPFVLSDVSHKRLVCTPNILKVGDRSRMLVYVRELVGASDEYVPPGSIFIARPPGLDADPDFVKAFRLSVQDRLRRGDFVNMECRGADAVGHALRAFCELQVHTAEFESGWSQSSEDSSQVNAILLSARRGQTWTNFNSTDFSNASILLAKSSTVVHKLAWAAAQEVSKNGIAVIHTYSDNKDAVNNAMKSIATMPTLKGSGRFICVPSFGRAGTERKPTIRFAIRKSLHQSCLESHST